ncbi:MAG: PD-(D/E)XK nuclease family protein, partial [Nanoarchaeota archaeon]|nr:PD-(D/E)XK nuclease family protein [Nanoarchaeota archaeon]MBU1598384.1 PD-(D/E)XK nuclease family protein [Nanoarchaeota archaeon]
MTVYSHSRISSFEQCPLKFKLHYIDEVESEIGEGVEAFLGSRVHDVLEKLYKDLKFEKINTLPELLEFYNSEWEKNWNENILIVRKEYDKENYRQMGERFITDYYNRYKPFDHDKTIGLEMRIVIDINGKKIQGFIDRLASKDGVYEIHDYKTANTLMTQEKADEDRQLALYAIAVKEMFSDCEKVELVWHYLAFDKEIRSTREDEALEELKKEVLKAIESIESAENYPAKESALCDWCEYQPDCPNFRHLFEVEKKTIEEFKDDDGVKLANEYAAWKIKEQKVNEKVKEIRDKIFAFGEQKKVNKVYGSDTAVTIWQKDCVKFPGRTDERHATFVELLKKEGLWDEFTTLDKFKLEKAFENLDIDPEKMQELAKFGKKELIKR